MPKLTIDGQEIEVAPGTTILQACEQLGIEIPRFCYHERLSIAGNCRMCLVEVQPGPPKPAASCAMPCGEGMTVQTQSNMAVKARKGVMEFLLANHPLDCPICDQGGECDLQDQAVAFGGDSSRFEENKRAVDDKNMGPLVKTTMTRCIHCTRCVRFTTEIAGVSEMGALYRGEEMEITTYLEQSLTSELSANVIDLCPVGALTSKPYAFTARPWELRKTESIDVMDAVGSNIRIDARGNQVMRVLPRNHDDVNEEWISNKTRFACDGLAKQRLDKPYLRLDGKLMPVSWEVAITTVAERLEITNGAQVGAIFGDQVDAETMVAAKDFFAALGSENVDCRQDGAKIDASVRASYLFNSTIAGIEDADAILIVGAHPRHEAALLNARIRKRYLAGGLHVGVIGEAADLNYPYTHLGTDPKALKNLDADFLNILKSAEKPMIILGSGALTRSDAVAIQGIAHDLAETIGAISEEWNGYNVLHTAASRVAGLDLGLVPGANGKDVAAMLNGGVEVLFLFGADEIDTTQIGADTIVVYIGHHGDAGAQAADVILPGSAYTEKSGTYTNLEGRVQRGLKAAFAPGEAKEDWKILRVLSEVCDKALPYDTLDEVRARLVEVNPVFAAIDTIQPATWQAFGDAKGSLTDAPFVSPIANFYMTDPISRCSVVMAECTKLMQGLSSQGKTGTNG
jgi:NADH-quinone oxidoreductase subunit G